jgi:2-keto-4-pentenoate hydratase/2-oxohepta-3-ene-1,7-dioic acid hydratase in catechol pathway
LGKLIVRYTDGAAVRWGLLEGEAPAAPEDNIRVRPLAVDAVTTAELIEALEAGHGGVEDVAEISARSLLSPVTDDATIFCQGLNYRDHAAESQHADRKSNLIFCKASSSLTGPYDDIVRPQGVELLDYEIEFGVILRRDMRSAEAVTKANLGQLVAGIVLANDVSARDSMFGASFLQWFEGKSYRTFCPAGPALWLLDPGEVVEALENMELTLALNGEQRQHASSSQLIWKVEETLSFISERMDLKRGDLLLTGTPGGVTAPATLELVSILKEKLFDDAARRDALRIEMVKSRPFMQPGDVLTLTLRDARENKLLGGMTSKIAAG